MAIGSMPNIPYVDLFLGDRLYPLIDSSRTENPLLLQDFSYILEATPTAGNTVNITILDPQYDFLESLLFVHRFEFGFQYGWRNIESDLSSRVTNLYVISWTTKFIPNKGTIVSISATDSTFKMNLGTSSSGFDGDILISDALGQLLTRNGLVADVEVTANKIGIHGQQANRSDMQMFTDLLKIAKPIGGINNYVVTRIHRGSDLVVRVAPRVHAPKVDRSYIYGRENEGRMLDFSTSYSGHLMLAAGGGKSSATYVDPKTKKLRTAETEQSEDSITAPKRHAKTPLDSMRVWETPYSEFADTSAYASGRRELADKGIYQARCSLIGDPDIVPMSHIDISLVKGDNFNINAITDSDTHYMSGVYQVHIVSHTISSGKFFTDLILMRTAGYKGEVEEGKLIKFAIPRAEDVDAGSTVELQVEDLA